MRYLFTYSLHYQNWLSYRASWNRMGRICRAVFTLCLMLGLNYLGKAYTNKNLYENHGLSVVVISQARLVRELFTLSVCSISLCPFGRTGLIIPQFIKLFKLLLLCARYAHIHSLFHPLQGLCLGLLMVFCHDEVHGSTAILSLHFYVYSSIF